MDFWLREVDETLAFSATTQRGEQIRQRLLSIHERIVANDAVL
jgi:hypothetical protein